MAVNLIAARDKLDAAIQEADKAQAAWSECVSALHLAAVNLRLAQKGMREAYNAIASMALKHPMSREWRGYWQRSAR